MFRRLFGESKSKESSRHGSRNEHHLQTRQTIDQLQQSEQLMNKKIEKFDQDIADAQNRARECMSKTNPDRVGAIRFIRRRKQLESQREKLWQMRENVELVNEQVQASQFNRTVADSLHVGHQHLKRVHKDMSTKKLEEVIDGITEQMDAANEINDLLANPIGTTGITADIDLENELAALDNEITAEKMLHVNLPAAHTGTIKVPQSDIDRELAELQRLTTG